MILGDTSVWVDHLHGQTDVLVGLLRGEWVSMHPLVVGELAMGTIRQRGDVLAFIDALPLVIVADHGEVRSLVERHRLYGRGLALIDAHLLASAMLTPDLRLLTTDRRLHEAAVELGIAA